MSKARAARSGTRPALVGCVWSANGNAVVARTEISRSAPNRSLLHGGAELVKWKGWSVSGATGYVIPLRNDWVVESQGQLIARTTSPSPMATRLSGADSSGWIMRLGVRMHRTFVREDTRKMQPYATLNWWHTSTESRISFNQFPLSSLYPVNRYELKLG
jgi:outer membrane autotransporter protein